MIYTIFLTSVLNFSYCWKNHFCSLLGFCTWTVLKILKNPWCTGKSLSEALLFAEHGENCSECQKQCLYTTCSPQVWACNFHVLNLEFNEQSVIILWVSGCKNKSFWQIFTCIYYQNLKFCLFCFPNAIPDDPTTTNIQLLAF